MRARLTALALLATLALAGASTAEAAKPRKALKGHYVGTLLGTGNKGILIGMYPGEVITMAAKVPVTCPSRPELKYIRFGYGFVDNGGKPVRVGRDGRFTTDAVRPLAPDVRIRMKGRVARKRKVITGTFRLEYTQHEEAGDLAGCTSEVLRFRVRFAKKTDPLIDQG